MSESDIRRKRLLAAVEDLTRGIDSGAVATLAYVTCDEHGHNVTSVVANASAKPVTLLGAVEILSARLLGMILTVDRSESVTDDEGADDYDDTMN